MNSAVVILFVMAANPANAQSGKGKFIKASIGFGISAPYDDVDIKGSGFYAQGECA